MSPSRSDCRSLRLNRRLKIHGVSSCEKGERGRIAVDEAKEPVGRSRQQYAPGLPTDNSLLPQAERVLELRLGEAEAFLADVANLVRRQAMLGGLDHRCRLSASASQFSERLAFFAAPVAPVDGLRDRCVPLADRDLFGATTGTEMTTAVVSETLECNWPALDNHGDVALFDRPAFFSFFSGAHVGIDSSHSWSEITTTNSPDVSFSSLIFSQRSQPSKSTRYTSTQVVIARPPRRRVLLSAN